MIDEIKLGPFFFLYDPVVKQLNIDIDSISTTIEHIYPTDWEKFLKAVRKNNATYYVN